MNREPDTKYWMGWYMVVLVALMAEILFFAWLTAWSG
jgi:hypothetical protein